MIVIKQEAVESCSNYFDDTDKNSGRKCPNHFDTKKYVSTFQTKINKTVPVGDVEMDQTKKDASLDLNKYRMDAITPTVIVRTKSDDYISKELGLDVNFRMSELTSQTKMVDQSANVCIIRIKDAVISNVRPESISSLAGLLRNDRIERLNGVQVTRMNIGEFKEAVKAAFEKNGQLLFTVLRGQDNAASIKQIRIKRMDHTLNPINKLKAQSPQISKPQMSPSQNLNPKQVQDENTDPCRTIIINNGRNALLGFDLKTITIANETGSQILHALGNVVEGLPGHQAGMRDGDRILSINGTNVDNLSHPSVLSLIKRNLDNLIVRVVTDKVVSNALLADEINQTFGDEEKCEEIEQRPPSPYSFMVTVKQDAQTKSIGISLTGDLCVFSVDKESDAERAGIMTGDLMEAVNGTHVSAENPMEAFQTLRDAVKQGPVKLKFRRRSTPTVSRKTCDMLLPCCRNCKIENINEQSVLGISLKERFHGTYHEIANVSPDSPASRSGLRSGDLVISVNGVSTHRKSFDIVRALIENAQKGGCVDFCVIDPVVYTEITNNHLSNEMSNFPQNWDVTPSPIDTQRASYLDSHQIVLRKERCEHYMIDWIESGSRAMRSGLRKNDQIISVNGIQLNSFDLSKATDFLNSALRGDSAEVVINASGDDAICLIKRGSSSWRVKQRTVDAFSSNNRNRYVSEPDIRSSKISQKESTSLRANGGHATKYSKIISSIKRFCSKERGSKRPNIIDRHWLRSAGSKQCVNLDKSRDNQQKYVTGSGSVRLSGLA
ncbi:hypothetical protein ACOME3_000392 [Neoechinorhynchus agilis]